MATRTHTAKTVAEILLAACILTAGGPPAGALTLYVAPDGRDTWTGLFARPNETGTNGPLASLAGARNTIRQLKVDGLFVEPVEVVIADGHYTLTEPVVFEWYDSGAIETPIGYVAARRARPVFSGGRRIEGFRPGPDGTWTAQVPEVQAGRWYFEQLTVNGRRATRARTPNEGYLYMLRPVTAATAPADVPPGKLDHQAFVARPADIEPLAALDADALRDVTIVAYHAWETSLNRIDRLDAAGHTLFFKGAASWSFFRWDTQPRYHIENYRGALDAPGEWFLARDGTLTYKPRPGEDMATAEVVAPVLTELVRIAGQPEKNQFVEHLRFEGLSFEHNSHLLPPQGWAGLQAAHTIPAAFMADGARNVRLRNCRIAHTGTYGIWFRQGCTHCALLHCHLEDLGAGGARIGETVIRPDGPQRTSRILIHDNIIHSGGRIHAGAIGVWIGQSGDNQVTRNDIADFYYTGISVGWTWGYGPSLAQRNCIEYNRIHHLGQAVLSDMGGVYTLGVSDGTSVSRNLIHDVSCYRYGGWGLYNDEGSSNIRLEKNLVYNTTSGGYHLHYGKENVVRNNVLAFAREHQVIRSRQEEHRGFTFERNIVYYDGGKLMPNAAPPGSAAFDHNLYFNASGGPVLFGDKTFEQWQAMGQDAHSIVADPKFADPGRRDFRLPSDSPAAQIGFEPFDPAEAGVSPSPEWAALAHRDLFADRAFASEPPPPPPLVIDDDFERTAPKAPPALAQVHAENRPDAVAVTDETAAAGRHCLKVADAPDFKTPYNPHLCYLLNHVGGVTTASFDLRIEPNTVMYLQWRDAADPYRVGPSFEVRDGTLAFAGQSVALPAGQWAHLEISAGLGDRATGTWDLVVTPAGQPARRFAGLKCPHPEFKSLQWFGFVSTAVDKTAFWLDNLRVVNRP